MEDTIAKKGRIHYAQLSRSPRLQRLYDCLKSGNRKTTRDIITEANICAVNTAIAELRANGIDIDCEPLGRGIYAYRMRMGNGD